MLLYRKNPHITPLRILSLSIFTTMLGVGIIIPYLPIYAVNIGAKGILLGFIFSGFAIARGFSIPIIGHFSDSYGRKLFLGIGLSAFILFPLIYIIIRTPVQLLIIRIMHGIASAMIIPVAMAYVADETPEGREGRNMGKFNMALFIGFGLGPVIGGLLKEAEGINANFIAMTLLSLISLAIIFFFLPEQELRIRKRPLSVYKEITHLLRYRLVFAVIILRFSTCVGFSSIMVFLPLYASHITGSAGHSMGLIISLHILISGIAQPFAGRLADRSSPYIFVVAGSLVEIISFFFLPYAKSFISIIVTIIFLSLGRGLDSPSVTAIMVRWGKGTGTGMGKLMGLYNFAFTIGMAMGPIISSIAYDLLGINSVFFIPAISVSLGILPFLLWQKSIREGIGERKI